MVLISYINKFLQIISLAVILLLGSCTGTEQTKKNETHEVTDMLGRKVVVPTKVERIVGLRAGALRLLCYMDAAEFVVGIEENEKRADKPYMKANPKLLDLPSVGPAMGGDAEMIIGVQPQVIFLTYTTVEDADALSKKTMIPIITLECRDLGTASDTLFSSFNLIGKIIGKEERAKVLVNSIKEMTRDLHERTETVSKSSPSVYVGGLSYSASFGIAATHPHYAPFVFTNAYNVASSIDKRLSSHVKGTFVDIEQLMQWNPDYIFIDQSGLGLAIQDLQTKSALRKSLKAVANRNVFTLLPYNNYATNYEYVMLNAWFVGKTIFPEQFVDLEIEKKADEVLSLFYSKHITIDSILTTSPFQQPEL
jgi:iron complex transport system substrate-binding protein